MAVKVETLKQVGTQQPGKPGSYYVGTFLRYLLLALIGLILFMPFILAALGTFKTDSEIIAFPPKLFPQSTVPFGDTLKTAMSSLPRLVTEEPPMLTVPTKLKATYVF